MTYVWPFLPQHGVTESLEWNTEVFRARSAEYRSCNRSQPRHELSLKHQMIPTDFGLAKELAKSIGGEKVYFPVWPEFTHVGAITAHSVTLSVDSSYACYKSGGKLLVWESNTHYEVVTIYSLGTGIITLNPWVVDAYSDAVVVPLRYGTMEQEVEAARDSNVELIPVSARFSTTETEDLSGASGGLTYPTYRTYPVITDQTETDGGISELYSRETESLDTETGALWRGALFTQPIQTSSLSWWVDSRASLWALRIWLHTRKGQQKAFWMPSWNSELTPLGSIAVGGNTLEIADCDYNAHYPSGATWAIIDTSGQYTCLKVSSCVSGDPGKEVLTFQETVTGGLPLSSMARMCRIVLSRFSSDRVEIQHTIGGEAKTVVPVVECPE
jgi:hypothetical protein